MTTSALLNSSNGDHSLTLTRVGDVLYVLVRWVPQAWDVDEPPTSEITLYRQGLPDSLVQLSDDLAAHLHRPLQQLANHPFLGAYEIGAPHARISLDFTEAPEDFVSTRSNGGCIFSLRWRSSNSSFEIAMRVDITTLDRFARGLADLVSDS